MKKTKRSIALSTETLKNVEEAGATMEVLRSQWNRQFESVTRLTPGEFLSLSATC